MLNSWMTEQIRALKRQTPELTGDVYAIAQSEQAATLVALRVATGRLPTLYRDEAACLAAWRRQPSFTAFRYRPYRLTVESTPEGLKISLSKRLDQERSHV